MRHICLLVFNICIVLLIFTSSPTTISAASIPGDINNDGLVNIFDLSAVLTDFGKSSNFTFPRSDIDANGTVNIFDLSILLTNFGTSGPTEAPTPSPTISGTISPSATPTITGTQGTAILYTASNDDIQNPERGFMRQASVWLDQPDNSAGKINRRNPTDSLVWVYFRLDNYRDKPIDQHGLTIVQNTFNKAREQGLKLVIRFIYNWGPGWTNDAALATPDAPLNLVLSQIEQLRPLLVQNNDVIAAMQAGFVGHWGEWHSSAYLYTPASQKAIIDALLAALPKDRMLMLRYPRYKEIHYGGPMTELVAFNQSDISRIGHHNDCFLADPSDSGTYLSRQAQPPNQTSTLCTGASEIQCWRDFISQDGQFTPVGGESCQVNTPRTLCPNTLIELQELHWSFINNDYHPDVLTSWQSGGCMGDIRKRLGYRLILKQAVIPTALKPGSAFDMSVTLENQGFASMYNERPIYAVVRNTTTRYQALLPVDPRTWKSGGTYTINARFRLPPAIVPGTYELGLWLPDAHSSIKSNPLYAVQFANINTWDQTTGLNILTRDFIVDSNGQFIDDPAAPVLQ